MNKNSLLYWFPKVKELCIHVPKTEIVLFDDDYIKYIKEPLPKDFVKKCLDVCNEIGFPVFMRTDDFSGKHFWNETCYVENERYLKFHVRRLFEESALAGILGLPVNALVFREFLELDWKFKAFEGMPVARERRYFIKDGKVICHHPYWVEEAIKFWEKDYKPPKNWRKLLRKLNMETSFEVRHLSHLAEKIARVLDGYWSVDFAHGKNRVWYLIDMAIGEESWHPKTCPNYKDYSVEDIVNARSI